MRHFLVAFAVLFAVAPAWAGGMGDSAAVLRQKNAICEQQRRGEGPLYPNMCLPELPVGPVYEERGRRH